MTGYVVEAAGVMPREAFIARLEALDALNPNDSDIQRALEACRSGKPFNPHGD